MFGGGGGEAKTFKSLAVCARESTDTHIHTHTLNTCEAEVEVPSCCHVRWIRFQTWRMPFFVFGWCALLLFDENGVF